MSLRDFWHSVRAGTGFLSPRVTVDSPHLDGNAIGRMLGGANIWLTPRVVAGFREDDFGFLSVADRTKLASLVAEFQRVASQVPPAGAASREQIDQALPLFRDIVVLLEFDRFGDPDAYRIGKQIEQAIEPFRPQTLADLRFDTGLDNVGDPALWVWAVTTDEAVATPAAAAANTQILREMLAEVARRVEPDRWPYVRFRTVSDQAEYQQDGAA